MAEQGRQAYGYHIRVERVGELVPEFGQLWGVEEDLPGDWDDFQREHIGDPTIHSAQIYRSSEARKSMQHRTIQDEFVNRDPSQAWWHRSIE